MGNIPGCCNHKAQLQNISEDKLSLVDQFDTAAFSGVCPEVAKIIRKIQANSMLTQKKVIQFPDMHKDMLELIKRTKSKDNETNDNDQSVDNGKKQMLGFRLGNQMAVYEGITEEGVPHGRGKLLFGNFAYFEGSFENGFPENGIFIFPGSVAYYKGKIENFQASGKGIFENTQTNYQYDGQWSKNLQHGYGVEKYEGGEEYCGNFMYGNKFGEGKYSFSNGNVYEGQFYNDYVDGHGKMVMKNGDSYEGEWKMGIMHGTGIYIWKNGQKYEGEYEKGLRSGKGTYYFKNGAKFEGLWDQGLRNGNGRILQGYDEVKGTWQNDIKIDKQDG